MYVTRYKKGVILEPETPTSGLTPVHVYYDTVPPMLTLLSGESSKTWVFLTSIHTYQSQALKAYKLGMSIVSTYNVATNEFLLVLSLPILTLADFLNIR